MTGTEYQYSSIDDFLHCAISSTSNAILNGFVYIIKTTTINVF